MSDENLKEKRVSVRKSATNDVSVFPENDVFLAKVVDISDTGMRIKSENRQEIVIQIQDDETMSEIQAQVVWARSNEDGTMEYGLKYDTVRILR